MRRVFKWLCLALLVPAVLVTAWVACNGRWADAAPDPVDPELQPRPTRLAPEHNAFFDFQGMDAPEGVDINAAGQASLRGDHGERNAQLRWPTGDAWTCRSSERDCARLWMTQAGALRAALDAAAMLGGRCERVSRSEQFEEVLPTRPAGSTRSDLPFAALPIPRFSNITSCVRWLGLRAVLEADDTRALALLADADRLARRALQGSRSLIGSMIGIVAVQNNWLLAGDLFVARNWDRRRLLPLLEPLPARALSPRNWIPYEAEFGRELFRDMATGLQHCVISAESEASWPERQWCRMGLGVLPEQSAQDSDARWLRHLATLPADGPAHCETLKAAPWAEPERIWPAWRNTAARWLIESPGGQYTGYVARQTDLESLRQTLRGQVLGGPLPAIVQLSRDAGAVRMRACLASIQPGDERATVRLPAL
jgi:hypothetical protein